jgi:hypothetical protein
MLREIGGVVGGVAMWFLIANVGNGVLRVAWPGYSESEVATTFTLGMLDGAALCWGNLLILRRLRCGMDHQP